MGIKHWALGALLWGAAVAALAQTFQVPDNGLLRLPKLQSETQLETLAVGEAGKLLIPGSINTLVVNELIMEKRARISIAPRNSKFTLVVKHGRIADGSVVAAVGAHGDVGVPGGRGTDMKLVIEAGSIANLVVDVSGGKGGQGWAGTAGEDGRNAVCWGLGSSSGGDGGDGSDGMPGGDGGNLELSLAQSQWLEVIDIRQQGGQGGDAGVAGRAGKGGNSASCWMYSLGDKSQDGRQGQTGRAAAAGQPGILRVL